MKALRLVSLSLLLGSAPGWAQNTFPSSGNVGVGTLSPSESLEVVGGDIMTGKSLHVGPADNARYDDTSGPGGITASHAGDYGNGTTLQVAKNASSGWANQYLNLIDPTTSYTDSGNRFISFYYDGSHQWSLRGDSGSRLYISNEGSTADLIIPGGNVGLGTSAPSSRLHSAGIVSISQGPTNYLIDNTKTLRLGRYDTGSGVNYGYVQAPHGESIHIWNHATYSIAEFRDNRDSIFYGNVGIGTTSPSHKLAVNGTIRAKEVLVEATGWADHVFADDYRLAPLEEVEAHIRAKKHLPGIPSAATVAEQGISLGEMQARLLEKIEELTLHVIELKKEKRELLGRVKELETQTSP
ncbi:MAG TPA: hypothetical protein VEB66_12505 [Opitutaceae bacterium]|nr:hypothetical protein [Opitutaceae bacterium]